MNEASSLLSSRKKIPIDRDRKTIHPTNNATRYSDRPKHRHIEIVQSSQNQDSKYASAQRTHDHLSTDHNMEVYLLNSYNQPKVDLLMMDDEPLARNIPPTNNISYHPVNTNTISGLTNYQQQDSSISSSVRKLLTRQSWRTSSNSQMESGIMGPILLSFDEGDDNDDQNPISNETKLIETRPLLDFDGIHSGTSHIHPSPHRSSLDHLDFMKKDPSVEQTHRSSPFTQKVQSLSNRFGFVHGLNNIVRRDNIPDPNRAISNLFGVKLNPLTVPNLLDTVASVAADDNDGVELLTTHYPQNSVPLDTLNTTTTTTGLKKEPPSMHVSLNEDTSRQVYNANIPAALQGPHTSHEMKRNNIQQRIEPETVIVSPYKNNTRFTTRVIPSDENIASTLHPHPSFSNNTGEDTSKVDKPSSWSRLSVLLSISYGCTSFAGSTAIALVPSIATDIFRSRSQEDSSVIDILASNFVSIVATHAVFSSALGKFVNGPMGDIFGATRVSYIYSIFLSLSLFLLSFSNSENPVLFYCLAVEFTQSVQWPCIAIILTAHYGGDLSHTSDANSMNHRSQSNHQYERSVYEVSIGSRIGQLLASLTTTILLHYNEVSWRMVCRLASQISFVSCILVFLFVDDSPTKRHHPQNPIRDFNSASLGSFIFKSPSSYLRAIEWIIRACSMVLFRNIFPSARSVLRSGTFWIVALGHSGGSIILTSSRILGSYFKDTSYGTISADQAGEFSAFLSLGIFVGLYVGGKQFSSLASDDRRRKRFIQRNYTISVGMCYILALLAVPMTRSFIYFPSLVTLFQIISTFFMGAGVAVQLYCIPAIVGASFGANKGLYFSYTDGVAYLVGSMVWGLVAGAVAEGNPQGSGWAYGWAAVALLVILAGWLMVEFVGRYFAQGGATYRHQSLPSNNKPHYIDPLVSEEKLLIVDVDKMEQEKRSSNDQFSPIITL